MPLMLTCTHLWGYARSGISGKDVCAGLASGGVAE